MKRCIILAICGKSASGKDSLARSLFKQLNDLHVPVNLIISDTTRPPRASEKNGEDYFFLSRADFFRNQKKHKYLEISEFRKWKYGTNKDNVSSNKINIGVFNPQGIQSLRRYRPYFLIVPIYLDEDLITRLRRSYYREKQWKKEFFRRAFADWRAFKKIDKILKQHSYYIILQDEPNVIIKINKILWMLKRWKLIDIENLAVGHFFIRPIK